MNIFFEMAKKPVFNLTDILPLYENKNSAVSALQRMVKSGRAVNIRREMYTCISPETGAPIANKYQIASAVTEDAVVSHHTAMEYYGLADQVFNDVFISSSKAFSSFEFEGITFHFVKNMFQEGIIDQKYSGGIRVTDLERTVVDSIKEIDHIAGLEEVNENIAGINRLNQKKILEYLALYDKKFLYQKCGFLLSEYADELGLTEEFFSICRERMGKSKRYLTTDKRPDTSYCKEWGLIVPDNIFNMKNGVYDDAVI